jgi:serine/threonine-protein kinase
VAGLPAVLDTIVKRATARDPSARYATADDFARDVEERLDPASAREIGAWVARVSADTLAARAELLASIEGARTERSKPPATLARDDEMKTDIDALPRGAAPEEVTKPDAIPAPEEPATLLDARPRVPAAVEAQEPAVIVRTEITKRPPAPAAVIGAPTPRGPSAWTRIAVVAVPIAALFALWLTLSFRSTPASATSVPPTVPSAPQESASTEAPSAPPVASASATPADAPPAIAASAGRGRTKAPDRGKTAASSCDPPYTVDARGFHHFKPSCM